jgi:hypothetical protein
LVGFTSASRGEVPGKAPAIKDDGKEEEEEDHDHDDNKNSNLKGSDVINGLLI